jgi:curved DNA-binding protein CbpA
MPESPVLSAYDLLSVHPTAPGELISASYWWHAGELQRMRSQGYEVEAALYGLTKAYSMVSDARSRPLYNEAIGYNEEPLMRRPLRYKRMPLFRRLVLRQKLLLDIDYYEVLGLAPSAPEAIIAEASRVMRDQYLRLPRGTKRRRDLLRLVNEAISVLLNEDERAKYDATLTRRLSEARNGGPPAEEPAAAPGVEEEPAVTAAEPVAGEAPVAPDAHMPETTPSVEAAPVMEAAAQPAPVAEAPQPDTPVADAAPAAPEPAAEPSVGAAEPPPARPKARTPKSKPADQPLPQRTAQPAAVDALAHPEAAPRGAPVGSKLAPAAVAVARVAGKGVKGAAVLVFSGASAAARGLGRLRREKKPATKTPPMWPAPEPERSGMFQRPLRRGDAAVEEAFLGRLASSVKEVQLPGATGVEDARPTQES